MFSHGRISIKGVRLSTSPHSRTTSRSDDRALRQAHRALRPDDEALGAPEEARRATAMAALLAHDQLREEQRCGRALCGFDEPPPPFPPPHSAVPTDVDWCTATASRLGIIPGSSWGTANVEEQVSLFSIRLSSRASCPRRRPCDSR